MRDYLLGIILFVLLPVAFLFCIHKAHTISLIQRGDQLWNSGHCDVCGGIWEYEQAVGHRASTSYIYICDNCGKRIELFEMR